MELMDPGHDKLARGCSDELGSVSTFSRNKLLKASRNRNNQSKKKILQKNC